MEMSPKLDYITQVDFDMEQWMRRGHVKISFLWGYIGKRIVFDIVFACWVYFRGPVRQ